MTKQLRGGDNNHDEMYTAQKMNFSTKGFFSKCDQIHIVLRIWPHLLKKSLIEKFIYCAVQSAV